MPWKDQVTFTRSLRASSQGGVSADRRRRREPLGGKRDTRGGVERWRDTANSETAGNPSSGQNLQRQQQRAVAGQLRLRGSLVRWARRLCHAEARRETAWVNLTAGFARVGKAPEGQGSRSAATGRSKGANQHDRQSSQMGMRPHGARAPVRRLRRRQATASGTAAGTSAAPPAPPHSARSRLLLASTGRKGHADDHRGGWFHAQRGSLQPKFRSWWRSRPF